MNTSIRLGRIAGIEIGVNWSWLVVFGLVVWSWSSDVFPSQNPGLSRATYVAMAVVGALAFFGSLLLHELGHSLRARREGMRIDGITLWLFGGVARFSGMFPSAGAEFRIAVAGPLVSLVLGGGFVVLAAFVPFPEPVDGVLAWLGYTNLTLLVFNLLPALPLDGGRVLRAALWRAKGDFLRATRLAAGIARGFGFLFVVGGIAAFLFASTWSGLWLALLGLFLLGAARSEAQLARLGRSLAAGGG